MSKRLLIVDDDNLLVKLYELEIELKDHEVEIVTAGDGVEAIQSIETRRPDVLLLDLRLPKADGFAVLRYMQENECAFPVLVLTNHDSDEARKMCKEFGVVQEYLLKRTVAVHELVEKLRGYLRGTELQTR